MTGVGGPGGGFSWTSGSTGGPSGSAAAGSFVWTVGSGTPPGNFQFLNGNVGIGTTNPAQKLDVAGNIKASGSVSGASFTGDGSALTLNASNLTTGTVTSGRLPAAGGDLSGTLTAATVAALQGTPVSAVAPASGQLLSFDGAKWTPAAAPASTTVSVNSTPVANPNLSDSPSIKWTAAGSNVSAAPHADCVQTSIQAGDTITSGPTAFATTCSIPPNILQVGTVIELWAAGTVTSGTSSTFSFDMGAKLDGATNLFFTQEERQFMGLGQTNKGWILQGRIVCTATGSTGSVEADGIGSGGSSAYPDPLTNSASILYDTTASHTINIYESDNTVPAGASFTMRQLIVKILP